MNTNYQNIKSFQDACKAKNVDPEKLPDFSMMPEHHRKAMIDHYKLVIIVSAINGEWDPDWSNSRQYKYYPWLWVEATKSGFGLSYNDFGYARTTTDVGARLCCETEEQAKYTFEQFKELYESYFLIKH